MKTMTAKYPGICKRTGRKIHPGDTIKFHGRGNVELVAHCDDGEPGDIMIGVEDERERECGFPPSQATLANDRRLAQQGLSVFRFASGAVMTQNSRGRCEDAPCCGCCS